MKTTANEIREQLAELQLWFARKPYGWTEKATKEQLQQYTDREQEQDRLISALEEIEG